MPFNMGLFNKRRPGAMIGLSIAIIACVSAIFLIRRSNQGKKEKGSPNAIESLLLQADSSIGNAPVLAEKMADEALDASLKEDQPKYIAGSWMILGEIQHLKGGNEKAVSFFNKAQRLAQQTGMFREWGEAKLKIGEIIYDHGGYDSALSYFRDAEKIAVEHQL